MSSSKNYTTVQQFGPREFDAVYIRSGEVVERSSYLTLSEAEHQARGLEIIGVPYRPVQPARGGFDRTATQAPDPDRDTPLNQRRRARGLCDIEDEASQAVAADESVRIGALPRWQTPAARDDFWERMSAQSDVEEQAPEDQADACDCFGCLFYGRCTREMVPLANFSVQDLGMAAKPGPTMPAWEIEMSRRLDAKEQQQASLQDAIRMQMDNALVAGHEAGRIERAAAIVRDGSLDAARDKYGCSIASCDCPDSINRGVTCKHQIAEIMAHNLRLASQAH